MRFSSLAAVAGISRGFPVDARGSRRIMGPIAPDTNPDCYFYDIAYTEAEDCEYFESFWGISHDDFVSWNPSVKDDCSGIQVGNSYCVEAPPSTNPGPTAPTKTDENAEPTGPSKPSPTQEGLINSCTSFYEVVEGDTCDGIVRKYGTFTLEEFIAWNPAVGEECRGLWLETYYCVGIPGTPTKATTTVIEPTATGDPKPSPTQEGLIESCNNFYMAVKDDSCTSVIAKHDDTFSMSQFIKWNPAVGSDCRGLWADTYYCVGIPGMPGSPTKTIKPPTTITRSDGISTPTPTQPDMVSNCEKFHLVEPGDSCWSIARSNGISEEQLRAWNPSVGASCSGLWLDVNVCVGTIGYTPPTQIDCHTTSNTKTWGQNHPYAIAASLDFCEGDDPSDGSGRFTGRQRKKGCFDAQLGVNKYQFEIVNRINRQQTLSAARCRELLELPIDVCERGGVITTDDWQILASVTAGRC